MYERIGYMILVTHGTETVSLCVVYDSEVEAIRSMEKIIAAQPINSPYPGKYRVCRLRITELDEAPNAYNSHAPLD